ncbi:MAG: hypothetical protein P8H24_05620 [Methylophilaceae bacterium]|nr:hypothetical protein [Methylophilaceae bacterium]
MAEFPKALALVVRLCGASAWCAQYLIQHPIVLDELLNESVLYEAPDFAQLRAELSQMMSTLDGDTEQQMDAMRRFQHACVFRFAAQDIGGKLALETLSDHLSALADLIIDVSIKTIWSSLKYKHIEVPKFAVIGYGKLGSKELGYSSDLDVIFLYDDAAQDAGNVYAKFAQRINNWFSSLTAAGMLYDIDLQLRPDGNSGLLVSSVQAFDTYQQKRAWVWEHQALTRARFVAGDQAVGKAFVRIRKSTMQQMRNLAFLSTSVVEMREKMRQSQQLNDALFDLKHSEGGIIDVEFIVQYLLLANASKYPVLTENIGIGNISLLHQLATLGVIDDQLAKEVGEAYRTYRLLQHASRLQGDLQAKVEYAQVEQQAKAVVRLWHEVFNIRS